MHLSRFTELFNVTRQPPEWFVLSAKDLGPPDVHAGAQPDVFQRTKRLDLALVVIVFGFFGHKQIDGEENKRTRGDGNRKVPG